MAVARLVMTSSPTFCSFSSITALQFANGCYEQMVMFEMINQLFKMCIVWVTQFNGTEVLEDLFNWLSDPVRDFTDLTSYLHNELKKKHDYTTYKSLFL